MTLRIYVQPSPYMFRVLLTFLGLIMALPSARAVVVAKSNDAAYTQPPAVDDFGFASVGTVFNSIAGFPASGVYLGDSWVISAYHNVSDGGAGFSFGQVTFGGLGYTVDPTTATRLHNPDNSLADLAIFRLTSEPTVLSASISGTTPVKDTVVRMMGNGQNRELEETQWLVVNGTWTETQGVGTRSGYKLVGSRDLRWGTNTVDDGGLVTIGLGGNFGSVRAFQMDFDEVSGEGIATGGDSGGGVFAKNGGLWELAGIMIAAGTSPGQPAGTVAYGNVTYAANLATYKAEIEATMAAVPEPATAGLLLLGAGLLARRRRSRRPE